MKDDVGRLSTLLALTSLDSSGVKKTAHRHAQRLFLVHSKRTLPGSRGCQKVILHLFCLQ